MEEHMRTGAEGNMVQPRKPVFPFTCDECHSSSYYVVAGSAQIDYFHN